MVGSTNFPEMEAFDRVGMRKGLNLTLSQHSLERDMRQSRRVQCEDQVLDEP
jgi:hypothetical protein